MGEYKGLIKARLHGYSTVWGFTPREQHIVIDELLQSSQRLVVTHGYYLPLLKVLKECHQTFGWRFLILVVL